MHHDFSEYPETLISTLISFFPEYRARNLRKKFTHFAFLNHTNFFCFSLINCRIFILLQLLHEGLVWKGKLKSPLKSIPLTWVVNVDAFVGRWVTGLNMDTPSAQRSWRLEADETIVIGIPSYILPISWWNDCDRNPMDCDRIPIPTPTQGCLGKKLCTVS